jgi:acyl dehydratase
MDRLHFEDVTVGMEIPAFVRTTHFEEWNRYAAVNDEFVPMHMDDVAGRAAGNDSGAFGMGNLRLSYLVNMLQQWIGDEAEIRELAVSYRRLNLQHDTLECVGTVVAKEVEGDDHLVRLEVDVRNQRGESTTPGTACVVLPSRHP